MKKLTLLAFAVLLGAMSTSSIYAQSEAEMKAWMEYMTPGDVHKMMASWDGEWNGEISMWMAPDAPPSKSTATCVNKMVLGGRYQTAMHTGSFSGMPFEGVSTLAYDNAKKKFISSWIDNMGTGMMVLEGDWDAATNSINFKGTMVDPMSGKDMKIREVFRIIDDRTQQMEMYMTAPDGKEYKSMEILFKRK